MGRFITIGKIRQPARPFYWVPREGEPRFVTLAALLPAEAEPEFVAAPPVEAEPEFVAAPPVEAEPEFMAAPPVAFEDVPPLEPEYDIPAPIEEAPPPPAPAPPQPEAPSTPLSHNLYMLRQKLGLTPEEFARPIIEDGEGIINRLEAGISRPSAEVGRMICETWGIRSAYLYSGRGPMFEKDEQTSAALYTQKLSYLLNTYLSVATFDRRGGQYWKGSLVTDLCRLIDVNRLDGRSMSRVVRVLYDFLDVDQFTEVLERMGR